MIKTRLEEIKALHNEANEKAPSNAYSDIGRVRDILQELFYEEHTDWLIDQAETVEQQQQEIERLKGQIVDIQRDNDKLETNFLESQQEIKQLKKNLSLLCPVADMPVIESLKAEKLHMMERIAEIEKQKQFYRNRVKYLEGMIDNGLGWDDVKTQ